MLVNNTINKEALSGLMLLAAAFLALILDNSPLAWLYDSLLSTQVAVQVGALKIAKPLLLWINDGLMAIFFFLIGLEIKRELLVGELSSMSKASLPIFAALGGLVVPALVYVALNYQDPAALRGWGVPVATDIAFALGVLALVGPHMPKGLKVLLLSLAIIDDLAAILIIAFFYTENLSFTALGLSGVGLLVALALNRFKVNSLAAFLWVGVFMWVCVLKSGVHATLAGVALAFTIPLYSPREGAPSPLITLEKLLHPWAIFVIMPIFAFANAGVHLQDVSLSSLMSSVPLGIILGLFIGKQIGVSAFTYAAVKAGWCRLPDHVTWQHVYGLSLLCGIGFTMSLFIGTLAFDDPVIGAQVRIAVLVASLLSAICGFAVLRSAPLSKPQDT